VLTAVVVTGCGSVANLWVMGPPPADRMVVYGGVLKDMEAAQDCVTDAVHASDLGSWSRAAGKATLLAAVDTPLSFLADTLMLPCTISVTLEKRRAGAVLVESSSSTPPSRQGTAAAPDGGSPEN
jgi:uncharacterized protein YceK